MFKKSTYWPLLAMTLVNTVFADTTREENAEIESIEIRGSYIEGYGAHHASGASRLDLPITEIPQSVSVITSAQIDDYQLNGINAVLNTATGINVERIETDRTYYNARGFDINNFQVDGIGLPLIRGNNHGDQDTAIYDRIEIIRGANGLMTGVGNPSATINFIRKRPGQNDELSLQAILGSWNNRRIEVDTTYRLNQQFAVRAVGVSQSGDTYLDRYGTDKQVGYLFAEYQIDDSSTFSISHLLNNNKATGNNWGANPLFYSDGSATEFDTGTNTSADWSYWDVKTQNTIAEYSHTFANSWYLRATYTHKTTDEDSELFYVYGTPNRETGLGLTGYASEYDHNETTDLVDIYLTGDFEFIGRHHEFVLGLHHADMEFTDKSLYDYTTGNGFPAMPALEEWDGDTPLPTFTDGLTGADVERKQQAVYFTTRFSITDALYLTTGGRYNDWEVTGDSYGVSQASEDRQFIPYIGAVYKITEKVTAYTSYTETFLSQTELDINNKPLSPITGESKELGIKSELFGDRLIASLAYFDVVQKNLATLDPATADLAPDLQRYIGSDGISSNGFEIDIAGEIIPGLQSSIGFTDFSINGDDLVENYTPKRIAKVAMTYTPSQFERMSVGFNLRWQDDISRVQGVVADGFENAGETIVTKQNAYCVLDLMARYNINEQISITLNANNITDEKYINSLYWAQGYYGAPANYSLALSYSL